MWLACVSPSVGLRACCVLVSCTLVFVNIVCCTALTQFQRRYPSCVQTAGPRLAAIWVTITSSLVSATISVASVTEIDEDSAHTEANDSLQVLLLHGKRQGVEMDASVSIVACAEAGASPTEKKYAGRGDLDDTQVAEFGRKRWKEDRVAKDMLVRCADDRWTAKLATSNKGCKINERYLRKSGWIK